jgi:hypothetical protein
MTYLSQHRWSHGGRAYEVNNYPFSDADAWVYEVYDADPVPGRNDYIEVRIPDLTPLGPFTPGPRASVQVIGHGEPAIPLEILLRVVALAEDYGHLLPPTENESG